MGVNILSVCDGCSCGQLAGTLTGLKIDNYFASEIEKFPMAVTQYNFPDTIQIGDIRDIDSSRLPKIHMLIGGTPCQDLSVAGKKAGMSTTSKTKIKDLDQYLELKADGVEFSGSSFLFWEYVRLLRELKPMYFLLENVMMKQEWKDAISDALGVQPIMINSSLLSAQNRKRLYWTNIPNIEQPKDKGLLIGDILEDKGVPVIKSYGTYQLRAEKAMCIDANYWKGPDNHGQRTIILDCNELGKADLKGHDFLKRVYSIWGKCPTLTAVCGGNQERKIAIDASKWRKLTPIECERLQTIPDNYTLVPNGIGSRMMSNSARYKMLGNGWTVDVIMHIMSHIPKKEDRDRFLA